MVALSGGEIHAIFPVCQVAFSFAPDGAHLCGDQGETMYAAIVLPAFNEEDSIGPLLREIRETIKGLPVREVVLVDDGSYGFNGRQRHRCMGRRSVRCASSATAAVRARAARC